MSINDTSSTLMVRQDECQPIVIEPRSQDGVCRVHNDGIVPTLNTAQGGQRQPCVMAFTQNQREEIRDLRDKAGVLSVYAIDQQGGKGTANYEINKCPTLCSDSPHAVAFQLGRADKNGLQGDGINEEVSFTLNTTDRHAVFYPEPANAVRRLTPLECLRLQGFPDYWLDIDGMSDTQKYKAIGNSVAIPCVKFVLSGIARNIAQKKVANE